MDVHPISAGHVKEAMLEALSLQSAVYEYEMGPTLMAPLIIESRFLFTSSLSVRMCIHCLQSNANAETHGLNILKTYNIPSTLENGISHIHII